MNKYLKLGKFTISLPVALTGFLGYFMAQPSLDLSALYTVFGIFLLALGSGALNQIQERHTDALMNRTSRRPLPSGDISLQSAIVFVILTATAGTFFLLLTGSVTAAGLGLFTLGWYNLVYTPLKRRTAFAVLPGALIGALPPLIGWSAAGRNPLDMEIVAVAFLLFVGQMPHYWLLLLKVGSEFKEAGLPVITSLLDARQIRNLSFIWIAATGACALMLPATPVLQNRIISLVLIAAAVAFLVIMFRFSYFGNLVNHWKKAFITVNLFYLVIILVLIADRIF
ncbi:MAG: protoheme IX farnesyltransferase [Bacteroidia bacterium]|nr:MAG: protoheme IX farnesyltransferase [Bacteroidia bacterium]